MYFCYLEVFVITLFIKMTNLQAGYLLYPILTGGKSS